MNDVNDQDRLMAALGWVVPIVAIVILLVEDMKNRPFQKYHAVNSLVFSVVFWIGVTVLSIVISLVTFGVGTPLTCCFFLLYFIVFYWAYKAYQGEWVDVPYLTKFARDQGWIQTHEVG